MATSTTDDDTTTTQLPADLEDRVSALAAVRIANLASAAKFDAAKLRTLKLEHARLTARHGADSPEVAAVAARFDAGVTSASSLAIDAERARVVPVPIDTSALTVHGRVVDASGKGVAGATVAAQDAAGKPVDSAKSDAGGRYKLVVPARPADDADRMISFHTSAGGKSRAHAQRLPADGGVVELIELLVGE